MRQNFVLSAHLSYAVCFSKIHHFFLCVNRFSNWIRLLTLSPSGKYFDMSGPPPEVPLYEQKPTSLRIKTRHVPGSKTPHYNYECQYIQKLTTNYGPLCWPIACHQLKTGAGSLEPVAEPSYDLTCMLHDELSHGHSHAVFTWQIGIFAMTNAISTSRIRGIWSFSFVSIFPISLMRPTWCHSVLIPMYYCRNITLSKFK